ncbi:MAG: hypothetical protein NT049_16555, partial [Planctomycetota bacterium]|nr:hypothetical protein [Planctomycetota bacterium]
MTAWPITTWTEGVDGFSLANANAFIGAINERLAVCGGSPLPTKAAGDDGHAAAWFVSMQATVE